MDKTVGQEAMMFLDMRVQTNFTDNYLPYCCVELGWGWERQQVAMGQYMHPPTRLH
jgi:hypothetical protein